MSISCQPEEKSGRLGISNLMGIAFLLYMTSSMHTGIQAHKAFWSFISVLRLVLSHSFCNILQLELNLDRRANACMQSCHMYSGCAACSVTRLWLTLYNRTQLNMYMVGFGLLGTS